MTKVRGGAPTVSERLATYATELRFEDLPAAVIDKAKDHFAYNLALAFSGHSAQRGPVALRFAYALSEGGGHATIVGAHRKALPLDAAFANSALIAGPLDDTSEPSGVHAGVVIFPAAWAVGEQRRASGKEALTAVVLGYDVMCKLADPIGDLGSYSRRANHAFAPFGAAATAGRLMGLSREGMALAMGHAGHAGMGVVEGSEFGWHVQGRLTRAGMLAASLAAAGAPTAPTTIEGAHGFYQAFYGGVPEGLNVSLDALGGEFAITETTTKEYTASGANILAMLAALELVTSGSFDPAAIADVRVVLSEERRGRDAYFESELETNPIGSLRFRIAAILLDRRIDESRIDQLHSQEMRSLLGKIRLDYEPGHTVRIFGRDAPSTAYGRVEIATTDGRTFVAERDRYMAPRGDWNAWLRRDGERVLPAERLRQLIDLVTHLEDVDDVSKVLRAATAEVDRY